jgi:hypothetical protein
VKGHRRVTRRDFLGSRGVDNVDPMHVKPGTRLRSQVCTTEVIVVKAPSDDVDLRCGGQPLMPLGEDGVTGTLDPAHAGGTLLGKRYADGDRGVEVLCTKAGEGSLSMGDLPLLEKKAKALPSSD